ncbi:TOM1-like protein 2 [Lotus japonicus]|uniref:TOM1-like protein 2 n=1 Tax=Lotus japonicus TaxID=34305 RepID=UPI00258CB192|nr:TOM1-like protein 2 [Lotus japonicus]XP_057438547.1 TOM1-like protein 2 [Lotus japonicus]
MDKLNLAQLGERLKTGGAQMGRIVSGKVKDLLAAPTPESKMVDEATLETLEEPNWGMNLRICGMINSDEFNGSEVVKAIKRKINHKSPVVQRLSLDLLETCAMNCEKVFSEVASEKLLEDMVRLIDNVEAYHENRRRAFQLVKAWGESEDLAYLPVFRQTYMSLNGRGEPLDMGGGNSAAVPYSLESYTHQDPLDPPERYPIPEAGLHALDGSAAFSSNHLPVSVEEKKEHLVVARNSLELLSSILNSEAEPKPLKEDLALSLLDKCKQSLSVIKEIVESTTNDEVTLFEALYLNDELQQVVSNYEELEAAQGSGAQQPPNADPAKHDAEAVQNPNERPERFEGGESEAQNPKLPLKSDTPEVNATDGDGHDEAKIVDSTKEKNEESSLKRNTE